MKPVSAAHQLRGVGGGIMGPITFFLPATDVDVLLVDLYTRQRAHEGAYLVLVGCGRAHLIAKKVVHRTNAVQFSIVPCSL